MYNVTHMRVLKNNAYSEDIAGGRTMKDMVWRWIWLLAAASQGVKPIPSHEDLPVGTAVLGMN
jgi:hypothetical protein